MTSPSRRVQLDYRQRICMAMDYMVAHITEDPDLEAIAAAAHFSPFHFHRIFKAVTDETVFGFLRRIRLEYVASRLLINPDLDITTAAIEGGFSSSQNFAKAFRTQFGMSPTAYRKSKQGNMESKQGDAHLLRICQDAAKLKMTSAATPRRKIMKNAEIKTLPPWHIAYARRIGPYGKETCQAAAGELFAWMGKNRIAPTGPMLMIYWDDPQVTAPENCRVDACFAVSPDAAIEPPIAARDLPGGSYLVCDFTIAASKSFHDAWSETYRELMNRSLECADGPPLEIYHNDGADGTFEISICIPLKS